jgi:hypothetical protein
VYGFGERKTPKLFVAACDTFIYVENLAAEAVTDTTSQAKPALKPDATLDRLLTEAVGVAGGGDGWAHLGAVGSNLSRLASDFDSRTWGYTKLKDLMDAHPGYQVQSRPTGEGKTPTLSSATGSTHPSRQYRTFGGAMCGSTFQPLLNPRDYPLSQRAPVCRLPR